MARSVVVLPQPDWAEQHDELVVGDLQVQVLDDLNAPKNFWTSLSSARSSPCPDRGTTSFSPPNQLVSMKVISPMMTIDP
jgi:hypothetical protein